MKETAKQIILTAKIGDGHIRPTGKWACAKYSSILEDYMIYKHNCLSKEFECSEVRLKDNSAGYSKRGTIYTLGVFSSPDILDVYNMSRIEVISQLDYFGFLIYYFDDGAYHKTRNTMHIYCNSFTSEEVEALVDKIYELFPYKRCSVRVDRKRDGREYPYLYVPRVTVDAIKDKYLDFVKNTPLLHCMSYKLGLPSQTIEKQEKS